MSADAWRVCPKCKVIAETAYAESQKKITTSYGKVTADEYLKLVKDAPKQPDHQETLREDYEILTDERGEFFVGYGCSCSECNFSFSFKHNQKV